jgi:hypothetical protein
MALVNAEIWAVMMGLLVFLLCQLIAVLKELLQTSAL